MGRSAWKSENMSVWKCVKYYGNFFTGTKMSFFCIQESWLPTCEGSLRQQYDCVDIMRTSMFHHWPQELTGLGLTGKNGWETHGFISLSVLNTDGSTTEQDQGQYWFSRPRWSELNDEKGLESRAEFATSPLDRQANVVRSKCPS